MDFTELKPHLNDDKRKLELTRIEENLVEHEFPPQLVIETTSYCNYACTHCSHREMIRPQQHMERDIYNKIVEEIANEKPDCEIWPTFYGEAFILGDELWDRLNYADKVGCTNLVLNSNGSLLNRNDNINKVLNSPLKRFILSLDGFKKETFEKIRFKGKYDEVYPSVVRLLEEKKKLNKKYPSITAQFSVMKENKDEVEDYRKFWNSYGAEVKVRPMLEWTTTGTVRSETIKHHSEFRIACPWGNNSMAIHQNGNVVACPVDYEGLHVVGNVRDHTVKDLWKKLGDTLRKFHKDHNWEKIPEICKGCGDWQVAGAEYEKESVDGTRPFWYKD